MSDTQEIPTSGNVPTTSYSMLEPRMRKVYGAYYKELYYTPERRVLDPKTQELISIAVSLVAKCEGCLDGYEESSRPGSDQGRNQRSYLYCDCH